jgi:hypothetical protein
VKAFFSAKNRGSDPEEDFLYDVPILSDSAELLTHTAENENDLAPSFRGSFWNCI